jgi:integrase
MARRPDFLPVHTPKGWMVSVPGAMASTGRRVRRFFPDKTAAEKFGARLRGLHTAGQRGGLLPAELALQAAAAWKILEPLGISLIEAARMVAAMDGASGKTELFKDRWARCVSLGEMTWSDRYASDMGKIPRWIGKATMRRPCGELTEEIITQALRAHGAAAASTMLMRRTRVMAVLHWKEERAGGRRAAEISILTPGQCAKVLRACESREQLRVVALLLFAGIRPDAEAGEISRLQWSAVGKNEIYVDPQTSKVADRHITIHPRLARLLRGHPADGPVCPSGWRRAWQRIRKDSGISKMQDVLRHTFASNHLAAFGEDATKLAMGHTKGSDTLFRHYRRAVTQSAGRKFFSVPDLKP